jgi:hypothetical protein
MALYVLEILNEPILVFPAESEADARSFALSCSMAMDLRSLRHLGRPLWDGRCDRCVRAARRDEIARWEIDFAGAVAVGEADEWDQEEWMAYLISVSEVM